MVGENFLSPNNAHKWSKLVNDDFSVQQSCFQEEGNSTPRDVPRGHLVVYVGPDHKRYVIKVTYLKHPLFLTLLDQARDEYEYCNNARLYIPCDEKIFHNVVRHIRQQKNKKAWLCF